MALQYESMSPSRDIESLSSWHSDWTGLRVAVLGLGLTGFSVADTLAELGCTVLVASKTADEATTEILEVIGVLLLLADLDAGLPPELAEFAPELVIVSPGFAPHHPVVDWAEKASG